MGPGEEDASEQDCTAVVVVPCGRGRSCAVSLQHGRRVLDEEAVLWEGDRMVWGSWHLPVLGAGGRAL